MSEWAYFSGKITLKPNIKKSKINLSYILQHAPKGWEGGLILENTKLKNVYIIDHSLRDIEFNESTHVYIEYWINSIKPYIQDLLLSVNFRSHKDFLIYYIDTSKEIKHTKESFSYEVHK